MPKSRSHTKKKTLNTPKRIINRKSKSSKATGKADPPGSGTSPEQLNVCLVSESTGSLARHIFSVAISQFPKLNYQLHEYAFCSSIVALRAARNSIAKREAALVFAALTQPQLKRSLAKWCERRSIEHFELMDPLIDFIDRATGQHPIRDVSRVHLCDDAYYRRMEAWEYTLQHDDSRRMETLGQADVILLGVSRVGKTPLCAYLGSIGYRAANVAITPEVKVPSQIAKNREKTVGLTIDPGRLSEIRKRRFELNRFQEKLRRLQGHDHSYYSPKTTYAEVTFAEEQFRKLRIPTLDITDLTVEESAARVLRLREAEDRTDDGVD